jgi:hypothetical protein
MYGVPDRLYRSSFRATELLDCCTSRLSRVQRRRNVYRPQMTCTRRVKVCTARLFDVRSTWAMYCVPERTQAEAGDMGKERKRQLPSYAQERGRAKL